MPSNGNKSKGKKGAGKGLLTLMAFGAALVLFAVLAIIFLSPFADHGEEVEDYTAPVVSGAEEKQIESGESFSPDERLPVAPSGPEGEKVEVAGVLYVEGAPLSGVPVRAYVDMPSNMSSSNEERITSSPFYYSAMVADVRQAIEETVLSPEADAEAPIPADICTTEKNGSFTLQLVRSRSVTFELDHDYYFFPGDQAGPLRWSDDKDAPELRRFDGRLEAELGAFVRGKVRDVQDFSLEGVSVELVREDGQDGGRWGGMAFMGRGRDGLLSGREVLTDDQGDYLLRGVQPDQTYYLNFRKEGYAPVRCESFVTQPGQIHRVNFHLREGSGIQVLAKGPDGVPLPAAEVFLEREREDQGRRRGGMGRGGFFPNMGRAIAAAGETGEDGKVFFSALAPGQYYVRASALGLLETDLAEPVNITETARNHTVTLNLSLGHSLSGVVVDDLNRPLAGAKVEANPHAGGDQEGFMGGMRARFENAAAPESALKKDASETDGTFLITGLLEGKVYDLKAKVKGYLPAEAPEINPNTYDIVLVMDRPGEIRGKVINGLNSAPVKSFSVRIVPAGDGEDGRGRGGFGGRGRGGFGDRGRGGRDGGRGSNNEERDGSSDGAERIMDALRDTMGRIFRPDVELTDKEEAFTDPEGQFHLSEIVPGRYKLCVAAKGHAPKVTESFKVEKGTVHRDVVVALGPGASIDGRVASPSGPVGDAVIEIRIRGDQGPDLDLSIETVEGCESGSDGRFLLKSLPAGEFTLRASHPDHPTTTSDPLVLEEGQVLSDVVLTFPAGATITGTAVDEMGVPLKEQTMMCTGEGGGFRMNRARTDGEGRFAFEDLRPGTYTVSITSGMRNFFGRGEGPGSVTLTLGEGEVQDVLLQRTPPSGVTVQGVITATGIPVNGGFLMVSPANEEGGGGGGRGERGGRGGRGGRGNTRNANIGSDGSYRVEGVTPGLNRFTVRFNTGTTFESSTLEFDIPNMTEVFLDIALPGGRVSGIVVDGTTGMPLPQVRLSLNEQGEQQTGGFMGRFGGSGKSMVTEKDGTFKFQMLGAGTYRLQARATGSQAQGGATGYFPAEIDGIVLADNQARDGLKFLLYVGGALEVRVTDKDSAPVDGANASLYLDGQEGTGGAGIRGRTDEEGVAYLSGVEPGIYTLVVQARRMGQKAEGGISILADQWSKSDISLDVGYNISARLTDGGGQAVADASLTLRDARGNRLSVPRGGGRGGRNAAENVYNLGSLAPGSYTLEAKWDGGAGAAGFVAASAGTLPLVVK